MRSATATVKRILVVDGAKAICRALESLLSAPGVEVDTAASKEDALVLLERIAYDGLVADIRLPGADGKGGVDLVRFLRERRLKTIAVLTTADGRREFQEAAAALGCRILEKPLTPKVLLGIFAPIYLNAAESGPAFSVKRPPFSTYLLNRPVQFGLDALVLSGTFVFAYLLRFEFVLTPATLHSLVIQLPLVVFLQFAAMYVAGVYGFIWRYVGLPEVKAFMWAAVGPAVPLVGMRYLLPDAAQDWRIPFSVIVMDAITVFAGTLGLRVVRRMWSERYDKLNPIGGGFTPSAVREPADGTPRKKVLLIGAGRAGVIAAREIAGRAGSNLDVKGFVDDDPKKLGAVVSGIKVLGEVRDLPALARQLEIDHVIITIARAPRAAIAGIVKACEAARVKVRIIPPFYEILDGTVAVNRIRDVDIEDLLGRDAVQLDAAELGPFLSGKVVLVTGAGGSIGSELARQVAAMAPSQLLLVERAEFVLFDIHRELEGAHPELDLVPLVADVGDEGRMRRIYETYRPAVVVHAAAHKHVPMMEWNPCEAVKNNVMGTLVTARLAGELGAEAFVLISTDKAVKPQSVMGASKRMAELVCQTLNKTYDTRYVAVRFGNVLGSTGSVIPIFREQIARGGPVTVTHPDMVRYFMTIPEAAQLVLQAGAMGNGGEIFVLNMGEAVKIKDLAEQMITLSGLKPYEDIAIVYSGARPGEKMSEELMNSGEAMGTTRHPKILIGQINHADDAKVARGLEELAAAAGAGDPEMVREVLGRYIPEANLS